MKETLKTTLLLSALTALLILVGYLLAGAGGALIFFFFSLLMNLGSFFFSDKIAISMAGGQQVDAQTAPELYQDLEELAQQLGLPTPRLYISNQRQPNAFATGRGPQSSAVLVNQGLLELLDRNQVRGVLAHELAHIKNRDVLTSTIAAVIAGAISTLANIGLFFIPSNDEDGPNPLVILITVILAPLTATIIQLAISRTREFAADELAGETTGRPKDLAGALLKLEDCSRQIPLHANQALSSLYIVNPFAGMNFGELFSTHPSTTKRVERLRRLG